MRQPVRRWVIGATAFIVAFVAIQAEPALALVQTFVSGTGGGATCDRTSPCADFATAHAATDEGGQVTCLDAGNFGTFTITKSITIDCTHSDAVLGGIAIDASHKAVTLRGLGLQGSGATAGVLVAEVGALHIEGCRISGFTGGGTPAGVRIQPTAANARVYISDTVISDNIGSPAGFGINIIASGAAGARVVLNRVRVENNGYGIVGTGQSGSSTTVVSVHVRDSIVSGNSIAGIYGNSIGGGAVTSIVLDRTASILSTQGTGVAADGAPVFFLLGRSAVTSNGTGMTANFGAHILSYQNNQLNGNVTDAGPTGLLTLR